MTDTPIRSGSALIDGLFDLCVRFLLWLADLFGVSYNTINIWIFCVLWPLFTLALIVIVIRQHMRIRKLKRELKERLPVELRKQAVKPTGALSKTEWVALDALTYDNEPIEVVAGALRGAGLNLSADEFLAVMFCLFSRGFITIRQTPISALGQEFSKRDVTPSQSQEVVGDLHQFFRECYAAGDYLHRVAIPAGTPPAGVPFGIYLELTATGRTECNKPIYRSRWQSTGG